MYAQPLVSYSFHFRKKPDASSRKGGMDKIATVNSSRGFKTREIYSWYMRQYEFVNEA